jgi:carboxyl-terminal processing protease
MKKITFFSGLLIGFLPILSHAQTNEKDNALLLHTVGLEIKQYHYSQRTMDDQFAVKTYNVFINWLDPDQIIFQEKDIAALKQAGLNIDEEINGTDPKFYLQVASIFRKRITESQTICKSIFSQPFQFEKPETWSEKQAVGVSYPKNSIEQKNKWSRLLKWRSLERLNKMSLAEMGKQKAEAEVRRILQQNMQKRFEDYAGYTDSFLFTYYLKSILQATDPHSVFFTQPEYEEYMGASRQGKATVFCGLGIQLKQEDGYIKVETVLPGGMAEKSGLIAPGDIIVSIGQEKGERQNTAGHIPNEVASMIVGPEGSPVTLALKKSAAAPTRTVTLKRTPIIRTSEWASSLMIDKTGKQIGYLRLPMFYEGAQRSVGNDVIKELKKLKDEGAEAIIFDLRDDHGGSFAEVQKIIGAFITKGPTVQAKNADGSVETMPDMDANIYYDGPLVVMINSSSASASELFSSAMQDYKRALLIGTPSFGKGTVQGNLDITQKFKNYNSGETVINKLGGGLWLTQKKFYRISGKSVQLKGIAPDVALPDYLEFQASRERMYLDALPYDEIKPANFSAWDRNDMVQAKQKIQAQVDQNPIFNKLKQNEVLLNKMYQAPMSLEWKKYAATQQKMDALIRESKALSLLKTKLSVNLLGFDEFTFRSEPEMQGRQNLLKSSIERDAMIDLAADAALELAKQQINK